MTKSEFISKDEYLKRYTKYLADITKNVVGMKENLKMTLLFLFFYLDIQVMMMIYFDVTYDDSLIKHSMILINLSFCFLVISMLLFIRHYDKLIKHYNRKIYGGYSFKLSLLDEKIAFVSICMCIVCCCIGIYLFGYAIIQEFL